jgi:hypothetical protein
MRLPRTTEFLDVPFSLLQFSVFFAFSLGFSLASSLIAILFCLDGVLLGFFPPLYDACLFILLGILENDTDSASVFFLFYEIVFPLFALLEPHGLLFLVSSKDEGS